MSEIAPKEVLAEFGVELLDLGSDGTKFVAERLFGSASERGLNARLSGAEISAAATVVDRSEVSVPAFKVSRGLHAGDLVKVTRELVTGWLAGSTTTAGLRRRISFGQRTQDRKN